MADKWIQLMSEDGTDNLFPTSKIDLLWTNASPGSNFDAQTISLDLSTYMGVYILFHDYANKFNYGMSSLAPKNLGYLTTYLRRQTGGNNPATDANYYVFREYSVTDNSIIFRNGNDQGGAAAGACIPYKIYGIK